MVYLVVKNSNKRGCYALKTTHGQHLVRLRRQLFNNKKTKDLEVVIVSRPSAYGEYAPYTFVHSEQEFLEKANSLVE